MVSAGTAGRSPPPAVPNGPPPPHRPHPVGARDQTAFLDAFDRGDHTELFTLWQRHIPPHVRNRDPVAQKLEFYLNVHCAAMPFRPSFLKRFKGRPRGVADAAARAMQVHGAPSTHPGPDRAPRRTAPHPPPPPPPIASVSTTFWKPGGSSSPRPPSSWCTTPFPTSPTPWTTPRSRCAPPPPPRRNCHLWCLYQRARSLLPATQVIFRDSWASDLRTRLVRFLDVVLQTVPVPEIYAMYKASYRMLQGGGSETPGSSSPAVAPAPPASAGQASATPGAQRHHERQQRANEEGGPTERCAPLTASSLRTRHSPRTPPCVCVCGSETRLLQFAESLYSVSGAPLSPLIAFFLLHWLTPTESTLSQSSSLASSSLRRSQRRSPHPCSPRARGGWTSTEAPCRTCGALGAAAFGLPRGAAPPLNDCTSPRLACCRAALRQPPRQLPQVSYAAAAHPSAKQGGGPVATTAGAGAKPPVVHDVRCDGLCQALDGGSGWGLWMGLGAHATSLRPLSLSPSPFPVHAATAGPAGLRVSAARPAQLPARRGPRRRRQQPCQRP